MDAVIGLVLRVVMLLRRAGCLSDAPSIDDAARHLVVLLLQHPRFAAGRSNRCRRHRQAEVDSVSRIAAVTSPQPTQDNVQLPQGAGLSIHVISLARFAHFPDCPRRD